MKLPWRVRLEQFLVPRLASGLIRALYATLSVRHVGSSAIEAMNREGKRYVLAFWHGHLLMMVHSRIARPITVMISQHRDGELIASTMERFGVSAARGSTTRGGLGAMRTMLGLANDGHNLAFTPDGPRGPRRIAQPGVVAAAQMTGYPIIPVAFVAKKKSI